MKAKSICLLLLLALFCSTISYAQWVQVNNGLNNTRLVINQGIVVSPKVSCANVYSGPSVTDSIIACVPAGTTGTLAFGPHDSLWVVLFSNGVQGWCDRKYLVHPVPGVLSFAMKGTNLFAGTSDGVFRSTNNGTDWMPINNGLLVPYTDYLWVWTMAALDTNLFMAAYGVHRSTDNGDNWNWVDCVPYNESVGALITSGKNLYASTGEGVLLSTNGGESWSNIDSITTINLDNIGPLAVIDTNLIAGTGTGMLLRVNVRSVPGLGAWKSATGFPSYAEVECLIVSGKNVFAGTFNAGIYCSTDDGTSWIKRDSGMTNEWVRALAVSGKNIFATTMGGGVFISSNSGVTWTAVNSGLPNPYPYTYALAASTTDLFVGAAHGIFRRPLSEMVTSINQLPTIAYSFKLGQNYPNPFNPATTVRYSLPHKSQVLLAVYNTLGQRVAILVQGQQEAGSYEEKFDGSALASGVYFYRLQAGAYVNTKKLLLLR